jgi:TetR/AcrR family transcriptional regulator
MGVAVDFQRARKPAEQKLRRAAILRAAAELFDAQGEQGAGLSAIAARAGFTKSNVYRYFESREEVLLSLFVDELTGFVSSFESGIGNCAPGDLDAIARVSADCFIARPRFCALIAILSSVLEQNVSLEKVIALKQTVAAENVRIASAMASRLPGATLEDCGWVAAMGASMVAGMWPNVTPSPVAAQVLAMPEFVHLKPVPERDLARAMRALLASIS